MLNEIDENGIQIYHIPDADSDEDEDFVQQTNQLKVRNLSESGNINAEEFRLN